MMALKLAILVILFGSIQSLAQAKKLTFTKIGDKYHIETDTKHYALYAKVSSSPTRTVVIDGNMITLLRSNCEGETVLPSEIKGATRDDYDDIRGYFLKVKAEDPIKSKKATQKYSWSGDFHKDDEEFSLRKLDHDTVVYSSQLFPSKLARVIISENLIFFVHYDGYVMIKEENCLMENERSLIEGIKKIKIDQGKGITSCFHPTNDQALKKYLKTHPIDGGMFEREQVYVRKSPKPIEEPTSENINKQLEPLEKQPEPVKERPVLESEHDFDFPVLD